MLVIKLAKKDFKFRFGAKIRIGSAKTHWECGISWRSHTTRSMSLGSPPCGRRSWDPHRAADVPGLNSTMRSTILRISYHVLSADAPVSFRKSRSAASASIPSTCCAASCAARGISYGSVICVVPGSATPATQRCLRCSRRRGLRLPSPR